MKTLTICIALLTCTVARSQALRDTIFSKNETIVVGKLKSIKLGVVTFDPDDSNDITVQLRKLKSIGARRKIYRIETVGDFIYFGTLSRNPKDNFINIEMSTDTITLHLEDISVLYPFDKSITQRFSGTVGIGFTYTRSSGFGRLNFDAKVKYVSSKEELSLSTSGIYTIYDTLFSRDKEDINIKYNYYFKRNWFATGFLVYQRNLELGLQRRYQEGLGIGNKFITSKHAYTWGRTGVVINQEKSTDDVSSGVLSELFGQLEVNFFRFEKPKINLLFAQTIYYSLSQSGRFRNDGSMSVSWEIFKDFYLSFEPYNSYDSKGPVSGESEFDFGIVFGINYKF